MPLRAWHTARCQCGPGKAGALVALEGRGMTSSVWPVKEVVFTWLSVQHEFLAWALLVVRVHPYPRRLMTLSAADEWSVRARLVTVISKAPSSHQSSLYPKATGTVAVMPATCVTLNNQNPALLRHSPGPGKGRDFESH